MKNEIIGMGGCGVVFDALMLKDGKWEYIVVKASLPLHQATRSGDVIFVSLALCILFQIIS